MEKQFCDLWQNSNVDVKGNRTTMGEIDWKRYAQLCDDASVSAIDRFDQSLRKASGVATCQSIPVFTGAMKGSLVTILRQMSDILKQLARIRLSEKEYETIRWKDVEDRMRETYFRRLCGIDNMQIAVEYVNTRLKNRPSDQEAVYRWVYSLQNKDQEISRIVQRTAEEVSAFAREDVPRIMELAQMGIRLRRP